ncbi:GCN5 family acetyltransferase [Streptomyces sp. CNQ-509]|uniref:GNAT family N-acetyltransferase n=1 Tax=Streptomyces sp. CNQ-509 TaxID=444103 RepID=UPI00062DD41C|nr:GNAT family N-acetyltransferase [Streptomyces sp. CNQ-509]AKH83975.1 GCN5 family acetyltransferase [Streptomyces sp. CNQ-509]
MGSQEQAVEITRARLDHLSKIVALARERSLDATDPARASNEGFLVSDYTESTYRERLSSAEHFYVAVKGGDVVGFLLAYSDERLAADEWLNHWIKARLGSFLVIKQVCVARGMSRQGIASRLYTHILETWTASPVIAAVVAEPANLASTKFHRKHHFEELIELRPPDGHLRKIWIFHRSHGAMIQAQYPVAIDLYKHEDSVNWNKLSNFFYITAALAAATGFSLTSDSGKVRSIALMLPLIGLGLALAFSQMLLCGLRYLRARKDAVINIEDSLSWHGGARIVSHGISSPGNRWLRESPTGILMVSLPLLMAACWVVILIISLS